MGSSTTNFSRPSPSMSTRSILEAIRFPTSETAGRFHVRLPLR